MKHKAPKQHRRNGCRRIYEPQDMTFIMENLEKRVAMKEVIKMRMKAMNHLPRKREEERHRERQTSRGTKRERPCSRSS